eukprot:scaffold29819_cov31-Tisochrysis_lutea.AAC.4
MLRLYGEEREGLEVLRNELMNITPQPELPRIIDLEIWWDHALDDRALDLINCCASCSFRLRVVELRIARACASCELIVVYGILQKKGSDA